MFKDDSVELYPGVKKHLKNRKIGTIESMRSLVKDLQ